MTGRHRRRDPVWWAGLIVAAAAAAATAHGLYAVARASDVPRPIAVLYPVMADGLALVAYSATNRLTGAARRYAWTVVIAAAGLSGAAQAVYLAGDGLDSASDQLRFGIGAAPAIAAAAVAHLLHLIRASHHPDPTVPTEPAPAQHTLPEPAASTPHSAAVQLAADPVHPAVQHVEPVHPPAVKDAAGAAPTAGVQVSTAPAPRPVAQLVQPSAPAPLRLDPASAGPSLRPAGGAAERAEQAAHGHRARHGRLPTATELVNLTGVSRGTAGTVLKGLRETREPTSPSPSSTSDPAPQLPDTDPTKHSPAVAPDQHQPNHLDHPTHPSTKIQNQYTPRHHDPKEDQLRLAGPPVGEPGGVR